MSIVREVTMISFSSSMSFASWLIGLHVARMAGVSDGAGGSMLLWKQRCMEMTPVGARSS